MVKKIVFAVFFVFLTFNGFSDSADAANRRTAVRYLQLAKQCAAQKKWNETDSQAKLGLAYDESVSDLWYLRAVSEASRNFPKADIIKLVEKAIETADWVDYNRDNADTLYADLLCSTLEFKKALSVLDSGKILYSSDAELIRSRCYYNLGGEENIERARSRIDSARRVFPADVRFADLFFRFEYKLNAPDFNNVPESARKIAQAFINLLPGYKDYDPDLELYASFFAEKEARVRMLKSFNARGLKSPLYSLLALKNSLLTQEEALDYYWSFAEKETDLSLLETFVPLITEEASKDYLAQCLTAYNGTLYADTDGDLVPNLKVEFVRGRAQKIFYDENQDDMFDWTAQCDFGAPVLIHIGKDCSDITYDNWPYVKDVKLYYDSRYNMTMKMIAETLNYSPFGMKPNEVIKNSLGTDFFFPFVISPVPDLYSGDALNRCALYYEIPSDERPGARIRFSLLDGVPQIIRYYENDVMYAQTQCENGYPQIRIVDKDGDGLFETTEFYAMTDKVKQSPGKLSFSTFHSAEDSLQIIRNLYGFEYGNSGLYLKMIQIDQNGDTIPDFTEEYAENEGKTSSWDFDNDGNWDVRYVKHPQSGDGILREESLFHEPFTNQVKSVLFENSKPVKVFDGKTELPVVKGKANLYWLGKKGNDEISDEILKQNLSQGVCIIVETRESRALAVKFGKFIFGGILAGAQ